MGSEDQIQQHTDKLKNWMSWGAKPERIAKCRTLRWLSDVAHPVKSSLPPSPQPWAIRA